MFKILNTKNKQKPFVRHRHLSGCGQKN